jgi:hypothetical protein
MDKHCKRKLFYNNRETEHFFFRSGFIFFILLFFSHLVHAIDFENATELSVLPFSLSEASLLEPKKEISGFYLTLSVDEKVSIKNLRMELAPELRFLKTATSQTPSLQSSVDFTERKYLNPWKLSSQDNSTSNANFEKLNFSYQGENSELLIGRKPVSLGVLAVFPVWNKFGKPFVTHLGPTRVTSQDQINFHGQIDNWAFQIMDIEQTAPFFSSKLAELTWFGSGFEIHTLFADWWAQSALGLAFSGDVFGTTVRIESLHLQNEGWQMGSGFERAFTESLSALIEFLYLENALTPTKYGQYGFARIVDKFSDLTTVEFGLLENFIDHSLFVNPKVSYSASNDVDFSLEARLPTGATTTEFSKENSPVQFLGGVRWVF